MIKLQQLTKIYNEKTPFGVSNIDLNIMSGDFLTLVGPSGSGKSTLLNLLNGSVTPDSGKINLDSKLKIATLKSTETIDNDLTINDYLLKQIKENITDEQKVNAVRTTLGLFELTTEIHKKALELSSGQYQRVLLCKCLVQSPDIILLDEPFTHLDQKLAIELRAEFFEILKQKEIAILWATHDLTSALTFSDQIAILNLGKVEQIGNPVEVYESPKNLFVADLFPYSSIIFQEDRYRCFRPESIIITQDGKHKAKVKSLEYQGSQYLAQFEFNDQDYFTYLSSNLKEFYFEFNQEKIYSVQEL